MEISKIRLTVESIAVSKEFLLLEITKIFAFEDNRLTDKLLGYKCKCILPHNGYEQVFVKVTDEPKIPQELLSSGEPIKVTFDCFEGRIYRNYKSGIYAISCSAKSVVLLK